MTGNQSDPMDGWHSEKKVLPDLDNIKKVIPQKMGEQPTYIWLSVLCLKIQVTLILVSKK